MAFQFTNGDLQWPSTCTYSSFVVSKMDTYRKAETFCDVTIKIGSTSFSAHKLVLSCASDYFYTMFTSGFKESTSSEITIDGEAKIFNALLKCAYSGNLTISQETVIDILSMASYMNFKQALLLCQSYLKKAFNKKSIGFEDAFDIGTLAKEHNLPEIADLARAYLASNFLDYAETDTFLENETAEFITKCLDKEDLVSPQSGFSEDDVLIAVTEWLKQNWEQRKQYATSLLSKVRLGLVWVPCLNESMDTRIQQIPECKKMLDDVLKLRADKESTVDEDDEDLLVASLSQKHPSVFATRSTISALITTGGTECGTSQYYSTDEKEWVEFSLSELPHSKHFHQSLIVVDGILYSAGGKCEDEEPFDFGEMFRETMRQIQAGNLRRPPPRDDDDDEGAKTTGEFYQYDAQENVWDELPSMKVPREKCALVELDGYIYAIGGYQGWGYSKMISKVERYSIANKKWEKVAALYDAVTVPSAVAFKGKIIVYGKTLHNTGRCSCGRAEEVLQIYDPSSKSWHKQVIQTEQTSDVKLYFLNSPPVLTVQDGICYIVVYKDADCALDKGKWRKAFVNRLHVGSSMTVTIAKPQCQDLIPENASGAFIINNQVFVNTQGYVHSTGIKTEEGQTSKVNVTPWQYITSVEESVVSFTFDKLRLV